MNTLLITLQLVAAFSALTGQYLVGNHDVRGWYVWCLSNVIMGVMAYLTGTYIMIGLFIVQFTMCCIAISKWNSPVTTKQE